MTSSRTLCLLSAAYPGWFQGALVGIADSSNLVDRKRNAHPLPTRMCSWLTAYPNGIQSTSLVPGGWRSALLTLAISQTGSVMRILCPRACAGSKTMAYASVDSAPYPTYPVHVTGPRGQ